MATNKYKNMLNNALLIVAFITLLIFLIEYQTTTIDSKLDLINRQIQVSDSIRYISDSLKVKSDSVRSVINVNNTYIQNTIASIKQNTPVRDTSISNAVTYLQKFANETY